MQKLVGVRILFIRIIGYTMSAGAAWLVYFSCLAAEVPGPGSMSERLLAALIVTLVGGFSVALVLMTLPWMLTVWIYLKVRPSGPAFFACAGVLLMVLLGCVASSLSWKPLFIEDQTFWEGVLIALKRQGVILALAGATIGLGYWLLAERFIARKDAFARLVRIEAGQRLAVLGGSDPTAEAAPRRRNEE